MHCEQMGVYNLNKRKIYSGLPFFCSPTHWDKAMAAVSYDHADEATALRDGSTTKWSEETFSLFEAGSIWASVGETTAKVQPLGGGRIIPTT